MAHNHSHAPRSFHRAFAVGVGLNIVFVVVEAICGFWAGSLALLTDAGHNLSDVLGLLLAWGASYLTHRRPSTRYTFGLRRTTILAALLNAFLLFLAVGAIAWEAIHRLSRPAPLAETTVIAVAGVGVVINTITAALFLSGRREDLNIRGAFLHMAADALVSLGVLIGGVVMLYTQWLWIDPVLSLIIAAVITIGTWSLFRDSLHLSLDAVPASIDLAEVRDYLGGLPGVSEVHDLHIWGMSTTETALMVHLVKPDAKVDDNWLIEIGRELHDRFQIEHVTIQIENGRTDATCPLAQPARV